METTYYSNTFSCLKISTKDAINKFFNSFLNTFLINYDNQDHIIILCIGTDKCTGDSLGPIIGSNLNIENNKNVHIYGTLKNPVHAKNLNNTINELNKKYKSKFIIAIDASVGKKDNVGNISIKKGPLYPGLALQKDLPCIGELNITGTVTNKSNNNLNPLLITRLYTVISIANIISNGLEKSFKYIYS